MPLDLPEPIETIARVGLEAVDQGLDGLVAAFNAMSKALAALDARVEALEAEIT
jgi:hypothetical protein